MRQVGKKGFGESFIDIVISLLRKVNDAVETTWLKSIDYIFL